MASRYYIRHPVTAERLRQELNYNPKTGIFRWTDPQYPKRSDRAGWLHSHRTRHRYWAIMIDGKTYLAHHLAWFYMTGRWPKPWPQYVIDHIDRNTLNNKWNNLREIRFQLNCVNRKKHANNTSGATGVRRSGIRWHVKFSGKHIGTYDTKAEAIRIYRKLRRHALRLIPDA